MIDEGHSVPDSALKALEEIGPKLHTIRFGLPFQPGEQDLD